MRPLHSDVSTSAIRRSSSVTTGEMNGRKTLRSNASVFRREVVRIGMNLRTNTSYIHAFSDGRCSGNSDNNVRSRATIL